MRPRWGLMPYSPQKLAGMRIEPSPSDPNAPPASPAATAAPEPPLDPPGVYWTVQGWRVAPKVGVSVKGHSVSSGTLVLPITIAPAARRRRTTSESALAGELTTPVPNDVSPPATSASSLIAIGTPSGGGARWGRG